MKLLDYILMKVFLIFIISQTVCLVNWFKNHLWQYRVFAVYFNIILKITYLVALIPWCVELCSCKGYLGVRSAELSEISTLPQK